MSSGDYGDVGAGGLATGGGIGWMVRRHGLTIDHVKGAELVLADGTQVRADADTNPDLFWAVRGGGSSAGVVTAFELEAYPVGDVVFAVFTLDATDAAGVLERWGLYLEAAPRELTSFLNLSPARRGEPPVAQVLSVWAGADVEPAVAALEPMLQHAPVLAQQAQLVPYPALVAPHDGRHTGRQTLRARNGYLPRMTPGDAGALAGLLESRAVLQLQLRSLGGAVSDVDAAATAYAHRGERFLVSAVGVGVGVGVGARALDEAWEARALPLTGTYANLSSVAGPEDAYPAATLARLREIKRRYDPEGLFDRSLTAPATAVGLGV
jgi:FAD/FMN-containing dehydrogenase